MANFIGHKRIVNYFKHALVKDSIAHGYLFYGPKGIGKKTFSRILAQKLIKTSNLAAHPNFINLKPDGETIKIKQVREAKKKLRLKSPFSKYKVIVIDDADKMTHDAQNSFLKILEEPYKNNVFILIGADPSSLLSTVISRVQSIRFNSLPFDEIKKYLVKKGCDKKRAHEIALISKGKLANVKRFLNDKLSFENYKVEFMKTIQLFNESIPKRFEFANEISEDKAKTKNFLTHFHDLITDIIFIKKGFKEKVLNPFAKKEIGDFSKNYSMEDLLEILRKSEEIGKNLKKGYNLKLALENLLILI